MGKFHLKKQQKKTKHFQQKAERNRVFSKTMSGWDSEQYSKHRCHRSSPSTPQHSFVACPGLTFHLVTLGSFDLNAV